MTDSQPATIALRASALFLASLLLVLLAACGDSGRHAQPGTTGGTALPTEVSIEQFMFQPETVEVAVGDAVTWTNMDRILHTVTAGSPDDATGAFDLELPEAGSSITITMDEAGIFDYFCSRHPHMRGTIDVAP